MQHAVGFKVRQTVLQVFRCHVVGKLLEFLAVNFLEPEMIGLRQIAVYEYLGYRMKEHSLGVRLHGRFVLLAIIQQRVAVVLPEGLVCLCQLHIPKLVGHKSDVRKTVQFVCV